MNFRLSLLEIGERREDIRSFYRKIAENPNRYKVDVAQHMKLARLYRSMYLMISMLYQAHNQQKYLCKSLKNCKMN